MRKLFFVCAVTLAVFVLTGIANAEKESVDYIHYRLAVQYKNEKKYEQAIEEFRKVLAAYPDHYNSYMHLAQIRALQGNHKLVIFNLQKALSYNPGWGRAQKMLADAYAADGQLDKAIAELQSYQSVCDPTERDSLQTVIGGLMNRMRGVGAQKPAAYDTLKEAASAAPAVPAPASIRLNPQAEAAMEKVVSLYGQKKYDSTIVAVNEVRAIQQNHPGAYYYAGLVRKRNSQLKMAKINFLKAVTHPSLGAAAHFHLGDILGREGNKTEAVKHLRTALASKGGDFDRKQARELLDRYSAETKTAQAAANNSDSDEQAVPAEKYTPIEIRIDSMLSMMTVDTLTDAGQKLLAGIRLFKDGRFDDAILEFKKVLADNPNGPIAAHCLYNTGICYYKLRLFQDAQNQFQLFLDRFPNHRFTPQAFFFKACCFQERGDYPVSERLFRQFIQNYRSHVWAGKAYERLGDSYVDLEQHKRAVDAYTQALAMAANSPLDQVILNYKLGNSSIILGNITRALTFFAAAIDVGEQNNIYVRVPDSYYKIADLRFQQKNFAQALENYKRVTRKYPSFQETPWGLFQIANIQRNLKQYREAVDTYRELMRLYPDDYWSKQAKWKLEDTVWEHEYRSVKK
ncbi:MAG: tetratricopeptide repeat protein [Chitinispirillales bacterium]|jgi:tetratricopeptide (TPR) repeat protein|nr:tetratricopeptide repeat protein [Chitinispirillales bacterium]